MKVIEINFNDLDERARSAIVVYSSFSVRPNGKVIKLINIENVRGNDKLNIEVFSSKTFYINGTIESNSGDIGIFTFRCHDESAKYFIKLTVELENQSSNFYQENAMFYGFYTFEETFDDETSEDEHSDKDEFILPTEKNITMKIDNKQAFSFHNNINHENKIVNIDIDTLSSNEKSETEEEGDEETVSDGTD